MILPNLSARSGLGQNGNKKHDSKTTKVKLNLVPSNAEMHPSQSHMEHRESLPETVTGDEQLFKNHMNKTSSPFLHPTKIDLGLNIHDTGSSQITGSGQTGTLAASVVNPRATQEFKPSKNG